MIKKERYQCGYCGTWYDTEKDAEKCEHRHVKAKYVETESYYDSAAQYPKYIGIRFEDGAYVVYIKK